MVARVVLVLERLKAGRAECRYRRVGKITEAVKELQVGSCHVVQLVDEVGFAIRRGISSPECGKWRRQRNWRGEFLFSALSIDKEKQLIFFDGAAEVAPKLATLERRRCASRVRQRSR